MSWCQSKAACRPGEERKWLGLQGQALRLSDCSSSCAAIVGSENRYEGKSKRRDVTIASFSDATRGLLGQCGAQFFPIVLRPNVPHDGSLLPWLLVRVGLVNGAGQDV
jgi:hypothetical protein